jgi:YD repeat-containing protein
MSLYPVMIRSFVVTLLLVIVVVASAQLPSESIPNFQTPNASSLGLFTQVPVSQFTGTPNISIPIYEIVDGSIVVPITLNYHTSAVRVHSHPGWVGLGWALMAGGQINRIANGQIDEWKAKPESHFMGELETGFYSAYTKLAGTDAAWLSSTRLQQYASDYIPSLNPRYEAMPDEFSFNFLGYSGKFFRSHDGQWKVISDTEIKVEFDPTNGIGFVTEAGLRAQIKDRINSYGGSNSKAEWSNRYFNKFTLVTPDGSKFEFGGQNAIEYSLPYLNQANAGPVPVTWFLTKITSPTGSEIIFTYEPDRLITSLNSRMWYHKSSRNTRQSIFNLNVDCSSTSPTPTFDPNKFDGVIMFPVYLKSISHPRGAVQFDRLPTTELRWPTDGMLDQDMVETSYFFRCIPVYFEPLGWQTPNDWQGYGVQRQWYKLDKIRIYDYAYQTNPLTRTFNFSYTSDSQERLKLLSIQETGNTGATKAPYIFTYNPSKLPSYSENRSNDHWDFYNGFNTANFLAGGGTIAQINTKFNQAREPDENGVYQRAEILEQIQYPTGGTVAFEYEPHTYSKVVDRLNTSLPTVSLGKNKFAGGLRIKRILHYATNSSRKPSTITEYHYLKGFSLSADLDVLESSGILGGTPQYYWPNYVAKDLGGNTYSYTIFSSGAVLPFGNNASGSHIGYSEVVEVAKNAANETNGYIVYKFSNFDTDIWGATHLDEIGVSLDPSRSVYSPYTSNEHQRGKLLAEVVYSNANSIVRSTTYKYAITNNGYIRRVLQEPFDICSGITASAQTCFVTAFKTYINRYNLIEKNEVEYGSGSNSFMTTTTYQYNSQNLPIKVTTHTSEGTTTEASTRYPLDFTTINNISGVDWEAVGISKLIQKNILDAPIEVVKKRNGQLEKGSLVGYKVFGANVFPHKQWELESTSVLPVGSTIGKTVGLETYMYNPAGLYLDNGNYYFRRDEHYSATPLIFDQYDDKGNVREVRLEGGSAKCYLWGYRKARPIAEILGATFSEVSSAGVDLNDLSITNYSDGTIMSKIATIRSNLPNAQVTGYTYNAYGITSKSDPNGRMTYYEYDSLGRLIVIKDHDGKILQSYKYHYSGEPYSESN